jgi:hypothetical protein
MKRLTCALMLVAALLAACQSGPVNHPVPTVAQIGQDIKCSSNDHGFEDADAGWGFCYPKTWHYIERAQGTTNPTRLDLTFDITDVPCPNATPVPGAPPDPKCASAGLFGFMIISTYERGNAPDLATWMQANLTPLPSRQSILWGDANEADMLSDGRRIALTPTRVVILELRAGQGQLDLEGAMSARLATWKFLV